jgi:hypothetical protein
MVDSGPIPPTIPSVFTLQVNGFPVRSFEFISDFEIRF